jgi:hypothetical protein
MNKLAIAILLVFSLGCAATGAARAQSTAQADSRQIAVRDYTVFVDPPTGFVFVKLPQGWKFAGAIDPADVAQVSDNVVTALLKPETADADAGVPEGTLAAGDQKGQVW